MNKSYNICNNCNKSGHVYNNCTMPITSYGIISIRNNRDFLMICRKDSLGYVEFIRGKYPLYNKDYIQNLIDEMTLTEKQNILTIDFYELWRKLWHDNNMQYRSEENNSKNKFDQIKRGIQVNDIEKYNLKSLIADSKTSWKDPEWGFPKGRKNYGEKDIQTAIREWQEETGVSNVHLNMVSNILPFEEYFIGSNYKSYKHRYYLSIIKNNIPDSNYQKTEVSQLKWLSYEDCLKKIRPYNIERIKIVKKINNVLNNYSLI